MRWSAHTRTVAASTMSGRFWAAQSVHCPLRNTAVYAVPYVTQSARARARASASDIGAATAGAAAGAGRAGVRAGSAERAGFATSMRIRPATSPPLAVFACRAPDTVSTMRCAALGAHATEIRHVPARARRATRKVTLTLTAPVTSAVRRRPPARTAHVRASATGTLKLTRPPTRAWRVIGGALSADAPGGLSAALESAAASVMVTVRRRATAR